MDLNEDEIKLMIDIVWKYYDTDGSESLDHNEAE